MAQVLSGARVFDGKDFHDNMAVVIEGAGIAGICAADAVPVGARRVELGGGLLAPGFIDVQVNGGGGALLNDRPEVDCVKQIAAAHRRFGTTGLLPTVITDAPRVLAAAIDAVREARRQAMPGVLGIHIEGPFLDPQRKGAHAARFIREMTDDDIAMIAAADCGAVMLTVAPNRVRPDQIRQLAAAGVLVSLGHSDATYEEAKAAVAAGARSFTHLYNAMSQMNGREPGMVGAALSDDESFVGFIADGHHVHDAALRVAIAAKRKDRLVLVSDAMPPAAGGADRFDLNGRTVTRQAGRLQLDDGTLAGSNLTMNEAVRHCVARLGAAPADALRMASANPAAFLGCGDRLGRIAPGALASLVHLDDNYNVLQTWIDGT